MPLVLAPEVVVRRAPEVVPLVVPLVLPAVLPAVLPLVEPAVVPVCAKATLLQPMANKVATNILVFFIEDILGKSKIMKWLRAVKDAVARWFYGGRAGFGCET